jgi:hypothetical protein
MQCWVKQELMAPLTVMTSRSHADRHARLAQSAAKTLKAENLFATRNKIIDQSNGVSFAAKEPLVTCSLRRPAYALEQGLRTPRQDD